MMRQFANPVTGKSNAVKEDRLGGKDGSVYAQSGWRFSGESMPDTEPVPWSIEWHRSGDSVWFTSSRYSKLLPQPWLESMTVFSPLAPFTDTRVQRLPTHFASTYLSPWLGWMDMGEEPGHLVWHSAGRKLASIDEIPDEYRRRVDAEYGGVLTARPDYWD